METSSTEILELLRIKNRCLDRLMLETRTFLATPIEALITENAEQSGPLLAYEAARAAIIETIQMHDRKINDLITALCPEDKTPDFLQSAKAEVAQNERLIISVFNADDVVFRKIGDAQAQLLKLIQERRKSREKLSRFKSTSAPTGEEMDTTL